MKPWTACAQTLSTYQTPLADVIPNCTGRIFGFIFSYWFEHERLIVQYCTCRFRWSYALSG